VVDQHAVFDSTKIRVIFQCLMLAFTTFCAYVQRVDRCVVMTANVSKLPKVDLRCSGCGAPGSGSCACGVGYVPAGQFAAKVAKEHPGLSSRAFASQTGLSQRTASNALRAAREQSCSPDAVVVGRDGKRYPTSKPQAASKPAPFSGDYDFRSAQAHIRQAVMAIKRGLRPDDWAAIVAWLKEERWETHH
jgi:hypothetical protein